MSQNSSISSSRHHRSGAFLLSLGLTVTALLCVAFVTSAVGIREGLLNWHFTQLVRYQTEKLEQAHEVDILLLGDSSLGNSVDAREWSLQLDRSVASVALTGVYGYAGALSMLRRAVRRHDVSTVVLVFTFDTMTRNPSHRGLVLTADRYLDFLDAPPAAIWNTVSNLDMPINMLNTVLDGPEIDTQKYELNDYVPQGPSLRTRSDTPPPGRLTATNIVEEKSYYLEIIGDLCARETLNCIYAHGPLVESQCQASPEYLAAVNRSIQRAGIDVVGTAPTCVPWGLIGDAIDHVAPDAKGIFSERLLEAIQHRL